MFENRVEAGRALGERLADHKLSNPIVLGLPRGGVPVAAELATAMGAPLDVILVRKLSLPNHPEYAIGAVGEGDVRHVDWGAVTAAGVTSSQLAQAIQRENTELRRLAARLRGGRRPADLTQRTVVIVDDGIATGSTVMAAIKVVRDLGASQVVVAAPLAPSDVVDSLERLADEVIVLESPESLSAIGEGYRDFHPVDDNEVLAILHEKRPETTGSGVEPSGVTHGSAKGAVFGPHSLPPVSGRTL